MLLTRRYTIEAVGWTGAVFSLTAFSLNSLGIIGSQSMEYLLTNIVGCFFLIIYAGFKKAHANWVLNSIWLLMTAIAFIRSYLII